MGSADSFSFTMCPGIEISVSQVSPLPTFKPVLTFFFWPFNGQQKQVDMVNVLANSFHVSGHLVNVISTFTLLLSPFWSQPIPEGNI